MGPIGPITPNPETPTTMPAKTKTAPKRPARKTTHDEAQRKIWKKELRDFETTQRRAERETAKQIRLHQRAIAKLTNQLETDSIRRRDRIATLKGRLGL